MTNVDRNYSPRAFARSAAILAAAFATAAMAQPAAQIDVNAGSSDVANARTVSTRGIDLSTERGRRILDQRIQTAATRVCDVWTISWVDSQADFKRCFTEALEDGRAQAAQRSAGNSRAAIRVSAG